MYNRNLIFITLFLSIWYSSIAQRVLTPEMLWEIDRISLDALSSDGKWMLYGLTSYSLEKNKGQRDIYISSTEGGKTEKIVDHESSCYNAQFLWNNNYIAYLSAGQLWIYDRREKMNKRLSDRKITGFKTSADGKKIIFSSELRHFNSWDTLYSDLPLASARIYDDLMYRHWDHWEDTMRSNLFLADLTQDTVTNVVGVMTEAFDVPLQPFGGIDDYDISADGSQLVYSCKKMSGKKYALSTNSDIYLYDTESKATTNITEGMMGYDKNPYFSLDGKYLVWNSMERDGYESDRNRIFYMNLDTRQKEELTMGFDEMADHPIFSGDGKHLYFISGVEATRQIFRIDLSTNEIEQITRGAHNYYTIKSGGEVLIGLRSDMKSPHEIYKIDTNGGREERLSFHTQKIMGALAPNQVKERWVNTHDGKKMLVYYIYPPNFDRDKKYPTLLYCQGGPQAAVDQFFSYRWNFLLMASQGYIVVAPNRRGLPSFGSDWNESISTDWGGNAMKDYLTAIDDAVTFEPAIDEKRMAAIGASYGGYSVYWLAGNHQGRFKSFISHCGLFNLESWYGTTEELFFANWDIGGAYWDRPQPHSYQSDSPHRYIQNWDSPMLVIHGEKDFRVPVGEGIQAFQAAQLRGLKSRFLYFPDEGHWVLSPQNGVFWHRSFFQWLDETL